MSKMKVLILGSNGYIGSELYNYLFECDLDVYGVDVLIQPRIPSTFSTTDLVSDFGTLSKEFLEKFTHIVLLAGHSSVSSIGSEYSRIIDNNVTKFTRLCDLINPEQILIYASSGAIHYNFEIPTTEEYNLGIPKNVYDYSKKSIEEISRFYPNKRIIGLRFGTVAGWSKNFRSENLINSFCKNSLQGEIQVSCGQYWRSVLGLHDLCSAIYTLLTAKEIKHHVYNLTSFNGTIEHFAEQISTLTRCDIQYLPQQTTNYSFNISSERFCNEFGFVFCDKLETVLDEIKLNIITKTPHIDLKRIFKDV